MVKMVEDGDHLMLACPREQRVGAVVTGLRSCWEVVIGLRAEAEHVQIVVPISFKIVTDGLVVVGSRDQFGRRVWMESRSAGVIFFGARRNSEIES